MYTIFAKIITNLRKKNVERFILTKSKKTQVLQKQFGHPHGWELNKKGCFHFTAPPQLQSYSPL